MSGKLLRGNSKGSGTNSDACSKTWMSSTRDSPRIKNHKMRNPWTNWTRYANKLNKQPKPSKMKKSAVRWPQEPGLKKGSNPCGRTSDSGIRVNFLKPCRHCVNRPETLVSARTPFATSWKRLNPTNSVLPSVPTQRHGRPWN